MQNSMAQTDSAGQHAASGRQAVLRDGIYLNIGQLQRNEPAYREYRSEVANVFGPNDEVLLYVNCDGENGTSHQCEIGQCMGYVKKGNLYISQGLQHYYYRVFILGTLAHYIAYTAYGQPLRMSMAGGYLMPENDLLEYVLDFRTGDSFAFNYRNFAFFLKANDPDLYQQLQASKGKRNMIHHFLLKYNERHPLTFPVVH